MYLSSCGSWMVPSRTTGAVVVCVIELYASQWIFGRFTLDDCFTLDNWQFAVAGESYGNPGIRLSATILWVILKLNIAQTPKSGNLDESNGNLGILVFHYPGVMEIAPEIRNPDARNSENPHFPNPTRSSLSDSQTKSWKFARKCQKVRFLIFV